MSREVTLVAKCTGINNRVDPKRLVQYDKRTGTTDLAEGVNIDIDDSGQIASRLGQVELSSIASHSLFYDGGDAFVAQDRTAQADTAIYRIATDFSLAGVRSGLVQGARVSYAQAGGRTFYTNGTQSGVIDDGTSSPWPTDTYHGPESLNEFSTAPLGSHIAYHMGRMWVAVGPVIYCSEPFKPGLFRLARCFFQFGSNVRMIRPVAGGVWVSDSEVTGFISAAESWDGQRFVKKLPYPAHEWSDNQRLVDLSSTRYQVSGMSAVWSSDAGLCVGTADGQLINTTEDRLIYPTGANGATVVDGFNVINTIY